MRYHGDEHFSVLPTRWRQKSTGIDMEQNYVAVTLSIHPGESSLRYRLQNVKMRPVTAVPWFVFLSVGLNQELCQSGWTDRDAVWSVDSSGSKEPCTRWHPAEFPGERATECDFITRMLLKTLIDIFDISSYHCYLMYWHSYLICVVFYSPLFHHV